MNPQFAADASIFLDPDAFGESITYTARGQSPQIINAVVFTGQPQRSGATPRGLTTQIELYISKTDVPTKPERDASQVKFSWSTQTYKVSAILEDNDPALWHLIVN